MSTKIATIGSVRNSSATVSAATSSAGNQRAPAHCVGGGSKPASFERLRARAVEQPVDERLRLLGLLGALDHGDAVRDLRLQVVGQLDRLQLAVGRATSER